MKILIHIGHPAHVHLFKNLIRLLMERGDKVIITAVEKEFSTYLLEKYGFSYHLVGKNEKGLANKFINLVRTNHETYKISKEFQPDIMLGVAGINISQVGKFLGIKSIVLDDTEHSSLEIALYRYFATRILTPSCFSKNIGGTQVRYNGYHELAYLHPNYFEPKPEVLDYLGLAKGEKFAVLRFVSWQANHDQGHSGLSFKQKKEIVKSLSKHAKIFISSEGQLPTSLASYKANIPPEMIHDLLYYASLFVGEGATMASESAVLGTPAIYVNSLSLGYLLEQEKNYGLVFNFKNSTSALEKALEIIQYNGNNNSFNTSQKKLIDDNINLTNFLVEQVGIVAK